MAAITNLSIADVLSLTPADTYGSDVELTGVDISEYEGNILVHCNIGVASSGSCTIVLQHNDVATAGDGDWEAVAAADIMDQDTGAASAFTSVTATASTQTRLVRKQHLKQYIRVKHVVASGSFEICDVAVAQAKYS